jgi:hypothetical protein
MTKRCLYAHSREGSPKEERVEGIEMFNMKGGTPLYDSFI